MTKLIGSNFTGNVVRKAKLYRKTNMTPRRLPRNQLARNAFAARARTAQRSAGRIFVIAREFRGPCLFGIYAEVNALQYAGECPKGEGAWPRLGQNLRLGSVIDWAGPTEERFLPSTFL
jgi:hypothetical protein